MKKKMVANLDVESFFPSIDINAVLLALMRLGISREPAELLAALMTCPDETGTRGLPQGAPTSPYMANHVLSTADQHFAAFCKDRRLTYTRRCATLS
jgi:RNA-directed DNA polymerase